jgi:hypothetical protein
MRTHTVPGATLLARLSVSILCGVCGLLPLSVLADSLQAPTEYAKTENRRVLQEIISQAQEALETLDNPSPATEGPQRGVGPQRENRRARGTWRIVNGHGTAEYPATGALLIGTDPRSAKAWCSGTLVGCNKF